MNNIEKLKELAELFNKVVSSIEIEKPPITEPSQITPELLLNLNTSVKNVDFTYLKEVGQLLKEGVEKHLNKHSIFFKFCTTFSQDIPHPSKRISSDVDCYAEDISADIIERMRDLLKNKIIEQENDLMFSILKKSKTKKVTKLSQELFNSVEEPCVFYISRDLLVDVIQLNFADVYTERDMLLRGFFARTDKIKNVICYTPTGIKDPVETNSIYVIPSNAIKILRSPIIPSSYIKNKSDRLMMGWDIISTAHVDIDTNRTICYKKK